MKTTLEIAKALTCLAETNTLQLHYSNVSDEGDSRGYTCGWAGFTTADQEVVACVEAYTRREPVNHLRLFLPMLRQLRDKGSADTQGLEEMGFEIHWHNASVNPLFDAAYEEVVDSTFTAPALAEIARLRWILPLSLVALFDAGVQHGWDSDLDSVPSMLHRSACNHPEEEIKLRAFLEERRRVLRHSYNPDTRKEWAQSVGRVETQLQLLRDNSNLDQPLRFNWEGQSYQLD